MSKPYVSLPTEQATWTRQQVEDWISTRTPESVFGIDVMEKFAQKYAAERNLVPADREPTETLIPAALLPSLGVICDPKDERYQNAAVHVDAAAGSIYATDTKLLMRIVADAKVAKRKPLPLPVSKVIPPADSRVRLSFNAGVLFKLVLSALASSDFGVDVRSLGRIDFYVNPSDPTGCVRVEVVDGDNGGTVRMVGAVMPNRVDDEPSDGNNLRTETTP